MSFACCQVVQCCTIDLTVLSESRGLSTCFMNGWLEEKVKEVIGAAEDQDLAIAVIVPVGYAAEPRLNPGRLPLVSNVFLNSPQE